MIYWQQHWQELVLAAEVGAFLFALLIATGPHEWRREEKRAVDMTRWDEWTDGV